MSVQFSHHFVMNLARQCLMITERLAKAARQVQESTDHQAQVRAAASTKCKKGKGGRRARNRAGKGLKPKNIFS